MNDLDKTFEAAMRRLGNLSDDDVAGLFQRARARAEKYLAASDGGEWYVVGGARDVLESVRGSELSRFPSSLNQIAETNISVTGVEYPTGKSADEPTTSYTVHSTTFEVIDDASESTPQDQAA